MMVPRNHQESQSHIDPINRLPIRLVTLHIIMRLPVVIGRNRGLTPVLLLLVLGTCRYSWHVSVKHFAIPASRNQPDVIVLRHETGPLKGQPTTTVSRSVHTSTDDHGLLTSTNFVARRFISAVVYPENAIPRETGARRLTVSWNNP